jgi:hypothetical protein
MKDDANDVALRELAIPIYIDTNALLDLLASIEDGFSLVEKVTTRGTSSSGSEGQIKGEFGVANVLSLLKIDLGASRLTKKDEELTHERESQRYHTYGSLFHKFRHVLFHAGIVNTFDGTRESWNRIKPSDFVEIRGFFRPNPLVDSLNNFDRLMTIFRLSIDLQTQNPSAKPSSSQKQELKQFDQIRKFLDGLRSDINENEIRLFVIGLTENSQYQVVTLLFQEYLRDQTMREISHREFRLLGKVVQKLSEEKDDSIELLQGTGLGTLNEPLLNQITDLMNQMQTQGVKLPKVVTKIAAPAMQVIPIAIYV